jgi:predicted nucleotidyltransferase
MFTSPMVIPLITDNQTAITALCQRYGVARLELFGSAAKGTFDDATSDLDFLVDLGPYGPDIAKRYLRLADALEALFGRPVDLLTVPSIRSQYFKRELDTSRQVLYAA